MAQKQNHLNSSETLGKIRKKMPTTLTTFNSSIATAEPKTMVGS